MAIEFKAGKAEASQFFVEPGEYSLRVIEATEDTSKAGNDMIKLKLRIIKPDGNDGPAMFDYLVFSENTRWKVDAFLMSAGHHPGEGEAIKLDTDEMIGWECKASLKVDSFDGKKGNKVEAYLFDEGF